MTIISDSPRGPWMPRFILLLQLMTTKELESVTGRFGTRGMVSLGRVQHHGVAQKLAAVLLECLGLGGATDVLASEFTVADDIPSK